jgi:protein phosphatase
MAAASDCGKVQKLNTDHFLAIRLGRMQETLLTSLPAADLPPRFEEYGFAMLVADGIGKGGAGARASRVALSALAHLSIRYGRWNLRIGPETPAEVIQQSELFLRWAHEAVVQASRADPKLAGMATSVTAVYVAGHDLFFGHAGHSKAFLFRNGQLIQLTPDQTLSGERETARRPRPLRHSKIDSSHVVTETLGSGTDGPHAAIEHLQLWSGDRLLLCTNGLTDVVTDDQIADVLALQRRPEEDCQQLIELALGAGGPDNVTVLSADYRFLQGARAEQ